MLGQNSLMGGSNWLGGTIFRFLVTLEGIINPIFLLSIGKTGKIGILAKLALMNTYLVWSYANFGVYFSSS